MNTIELTKEWVLLSDNTIYRNASNAPIQIFAGTPTEDSIPLTLLPNETFKTTTNVYARTLVDNTFLVVDDYSVSSFLIDFIAGSGTPDFSTDTIHTNNIVEKDGNGITISGDLTPVGNENLGSSSKPFDEVYGNTGSFDTIKSITETTTGITSDSNITFPTGTQINLGSSSKIMGDDNGNIDIVAGTSKFNGNITQNENNVIDTSYSLPKGEILWLSPKGCTTESIAQENGVIDVSGNGNNGTAYNGVQIISSSNFSQKFEFVSNSYIETNNIYFSNTNEITISFYLYLNSISYNQIIIKKSGSKQELNLSYWNNKLYLTVWSSDNSSIDVNGGELNQLKWYLITGVIDKNNNIIKLYINGILKNSRNITNLTIPFTNNTKFLVGNDNNSNWWCRGSVYDIRMYPYALTDKQVMALYQYGQQPQDVSNNLEISNIKSNYLPLSGGTMTGALTTKIITPYVDNTYNLGSSSKYWLNSYVTTTHTDAITEKTSNNGISLTGSLIPSNTTTSLGNTTSPFHQVSSTDINITEVPYYTLGEPSTLIGGDYRSEGYFGEVQASNFIYGWEVLAQLADMDMSTITSKAEFISSFSTFLSAFNGSSSIAYTFTGSSYTSLGVSDNLEVEWLKFICDGCLMFIPKRPLLNNITWDEINTVLGNVAIGKDIVISLSRINSNYSTGNETVTLKCRLLTGGNHQPFIIGNVNDRGKTGTQLGRGSEWNRLMYRVCSQIPTDTHSGASSGYSGGKQIGDNWASLTASQLGFGASNDLGRASWCQEYCRYTDATVRRVTRGNVGGVGNLNNDTPSARGTFYGFRPALVLEL